MEPPPDSTAPAQGPPSQRAGKRRRRGKGRVSDDDWAEKHGIKCESFAEKRAICAQRGDMLTGWSIVRDLEGNEAERHLERFSDDLIEMTERAALLIDDNGVPHRSYSTSWAARSVVAFVVFVASNCAPDTLHGRPTYRMAGFTLGFLRMLCALEVVAQGVRSMRRPGRSTFGHIAKKKGSHADPRGWIGELVKVGLIEGFQFPACSVGPQQRGPMRADGTQWSFIQVFLKVNPYKPGLDGPAPIRKRKVVKLAVVNRARTLVERMARNKARREEYDRAARDESEYLHPSLQGRPDRVAVLLGNEPPPPPPLVDATGDSLSAKLLAQLLAAEDRYSERHKPPD